MALRRVEGVSHTAAPLVPGKRPRCPRCCDGTTKIGKASPNVPWSFNEHPVTTQELILLGAQSPLKHRPSFAYGIRAQEVFAGSGVWTEAMREAGIAHNIPLELYGDPLQKKDRRPEFDLEDPKVAAHYLKETQALPGPNTANVWEFGTPCTSFCDFCLLNGGTRNYSAPEGRDPLTSSERAGNYCCQLTCQMCEQLFLHDKEFILESSMPSGRYPKIWDQPAVQRLQEQTGSLIVPTHLCEWGCAPTDQPKLRYKKGQWNLVSPGLYYHALLLARRCRGLHKHLDVKGESHLPGVPRTRQAQVYPKRLCQGWALVIQASYHGWGTLRVAAALDQLEDDGQQGDIPQKGTTPPHFSDQRPAKCGSSEDSEFMDGFGLLAGLLGGGQRCGSIGGYEVGWKQWCLWRRMSSKSVYLRRRSRTRTTCCASPRTWPMSWGGLKGPSSSGCLR